MAKLSNFKLNTKEGNSMDGKKKKREAEVEEVPETKPKKDRVMTKELTEVGKEFLTAMDVSDKQYALMQMYAEQTGIPVTGITIMGGKPYVNVTGLDAKIQKDRRKVKRIDFVCLKHAEKDDMRAGYIGIVEFEDTNERMKMRQEVIMKAIEEGYEVDKIEQMIDRLGLSAPIYRDEGWAGTESVKMSTMKNLDFLNMMAIRRATNRAKRQAVGCGLTTVDEMPFGWQEVYGNAGGGGGVKQVPHVEGQDDDFFKKEGKK
jgi:hypothetical protein